MTFRSSAMVYKVRCNSCSVIDEYDKSEIWNAGSFARPIWVVSCHSCVNRVPILESSGIFPIVEEVVLELDKDTEGITMSRRLDGDGGKDKENADQRAQKGNIKEYWIQEFFREEYAKYGFKSIKGPFTSGPDFLTDGGEGIEVERHWKYYISHRHHVTPSFKSVKFLILLCPEIPPQKKTHLLPPEIIFINVEEFVPWFRDKCKTFVEARKMSQQEQQLTLRLELLKGEFYRRYLEVCPDTERDMANCPGCQNCAYQPEFDFTFWAIDFVIQYDYLIYDDDFSFGEIDPTHLDLFFKKMLLEN